MKVLSLLAQKGGTGKSTLAAHLADMPVGDGDGAGDAVFQVRHGGLTLWIVEF